METFEADVTHLSQQGFGVVKSPDRITWFVRGTWRGDRVVLRPTAETDGDYRFAELVSILRPSADRREAPCPHLGGGDEQCFGCPWMMVQYPEQLREKQHRVQYALERVGLPEAPVAPIWASPEEWGYRRRAQFKTDGQLIGYAGRQGLRIAPIQDCRVLSPKMQAHYRVLQQRLPEAAWTPGSGHVWNYLDLDEGSDPQAVPLNRRRPFLQANAAQNAAMRRWLAQRLVGMDRSLKALELFAGSGNFTEVLSAEGFTDILALEVGADAIEALNQKGFPGVQGLRFDLYGKRAAQAVGRLAPETQLLVANPPRDGLRDHARLPRSLPRLQAIALISCDPVFFAHDARRLAQEGFKLQAAQPLDQMPHTPHVEILGWFERG